MGKHIQNYTCPTSLLVAWFTTNIHSQMSSICRPTSSTFVYKSTEQEGYTDFPAPLQWYDNYAYYCIEQIKHSGMTCVPEKSGLILKQSNDLRFRYGFMQYFQINANFVPRNRQWMLPCPAFLVTLCKHYSI
jgi:hypothetical protein